MTEVTDFLRTIATEFESEGFWSPAEIAINDADFSGSVELLISSLEVASEHPNWIPRFDLVVPGDAGPDPDKQIITSSANPQLNIDDLKDSFGEHISDHTDYAGQIQRAFNETEFEQAIEDIVAAVPEDKPLLGSITVDKKSVLSDLYPDDNPPNELQLWVNQATVEGWIASEDTESIIEKQFDGDSLPYHVFLDLEAEQSQYLGFCELEDLVKKEAVSPEESTQKFLAQEQSLSDLFSGTDLRRPEITPAIFDIEAAIQAYSKVVVATSMMVLAESWELQNDSLGLTTLTHRHRIDETLELDSIDSAFSSKETREIRDLVYEVHSGDYTISISFWHQAVASQCSSFKDIPNNRASISHYAGFLQEESAKEDLEQLQNTVEEVSELTRTIANSLSEASRGLSSNLQNIVIALLGAIVTNFVLILRYSDFYVLAPFSVAAISGILIFYFPIIQGKVATTQELMENRISDFLMYFNEIRSHVDSRVFDLEEIGEQLEAHLQTAASSLITARRTVNRIYILMLSIWAIVVIYGYLVSIPISEEVIRTTLSDIGLNTSVSDGQNLISVTLIFSTLPAFWILLKNCKEIGSVRRVFSGTEIPTEVDVKLPVNIPKTDSSRKHDTEVFEEIGSETYATYFPLISMSLLLVIIGVGLLELTRSLGMW